MQIKDIIRVNDVIQLLENAQKGWVSCLMIVDEIKSWGVQAYMKLPLQGDAYLRIPWDQFTLIGKAIMVHPDSIEEENK